MSYPPKRTKNLIFYHNREQAYPNIQEKTGLLDQDFTCSPLHDMELEAVPDNGHYMEGDGGDGSGSLSLICCGSNSSSNREAASCNTGISLIMLFQTISRLTA